MTKFNTMKYYPLLFMLFFSVISMNSQSVDLIATVDVTPPLNNGQTFNYSIMSTGNPYNAIRIKLNYDPSIIQLNSLTPVYAFDFTPVNDTTTPGLIKYEAAEFSGNIGTDEVIFTIEFEVLDNSQAISIAHDYNAADGTVVITNSGNDILGTANDILLETLSIDVLNAGNDIFVFPNPAQDIVSVKLANNQINIESIIVQTLEGKTILSKQIEKAMHVNLIHVDISALPNALYFLTIKTQDGIQKVNKLLVAH